MKKFICIFGQTKNGKTTFANMLHSRLNDRTNCTRWWVKHSFANPLKQAICGIYGVTMKWLDENKDIVPPGWKTTPRQQMIELADLVRQNYPDIFVEQALNVHSEFIIDDGRFENEARQSKALGGYNILIVRPSHVVYPHMQPAISSTERFCGVLATNLLKESPDHRDERLDLFDQVIINNVGLDKLEEVADQLAYTLANSYLRTPMTGKVEQVSENRFE